VSVARGRFIVLEGGDGVGKTTQLTRLESALRAQGLNVRTIREPGETAAGVRIRELLLDPASMLAPTTEVLLFLAARAQVTAEIVRPALDAGTWVLADRYFVSTYAYQIAGHGLDEAGVRAANAVATGGVRPDLTLLLEVPVAEAERRRQGRGTADRLELYGEGFQARVAAAYQAAVTPAWQARHPECGPIVAVPADGPPEAVTERLLGSVLEQFPLRHALT
jgi:dTMP kinase